MKQRLYDITNRVIGPVVFTAVFVPTVVADAIVRRMDEAARRAMARHQWRQIERGLEPYQDWERLR